MLVASSLPLTLLPLRVLRRNVPLATLRRGLRIGLRLRGSAPVARRRGAVLRADVPKHRWPHGPRVSHTRIASAEVLFNPVLQPTP